MPINMHLPCQKHKRLYINELIIAPVSESGHFCNCPLYCTDNRSIFFLTFPIFALMITTESFKVEASTLTRIIMKQWIKKHILILSLPPVILLFFGTLFDLRLVIVALMYVFVIIPPIMMIVYFYHAMSPEARYSLLPHSVACDSEGLHINYLPHDDISLPRDPEIIPWTKISSYKASSTEITLILSLSAYSIIYIPYTAFDDQKKLRSMCDFIAKNLRS